MVYKIQIISKEEKAHSAIFSFTRSDFENSQHPPLLTFHTNRNHSIIACRDQPNSFFGLVEEVRTNDIEFDRRISEIQCTDLQCYVLLERSYAENRQERCQIFNKNFQFLDQINLPWTSELGCRMFTLGDKEHLFKFEKGSKGSGVTLKVYHLSRSYKLTRRRKLEFEASPYGFSFRNFVLAREVDQGYVFLYLVSGRLKMATISKNYLLLNQSSDSLNAAGVQCICRQGPEIWGWGGSELMYFEPIYQLYE